MTRDVDMEEANKITLDQEALDCATDAATAAFAAGGEEAEQLEAGVRAYLWAVSTKSELSAKDLAELAHKDAIREVAYNSMLNLLDTLKPTFKPQEQGYNNVDHARLTIAMQAKTTVDRLSSKHLKAWGV